LIWFSCFCWASSILSVTLRLVASDLETEVSAARQPDSDPIWEKPTVSSAAVAGSERVMATSAVAARRTLEVMRRILPNVVQGACMPEFGIKAPLRLSIDGSAGNISRKIGAD